MKISLSHVTYTYPSAARPALVDCSLDIPSGTFCLVIGPSGAGKSTLLRTLNGLVPHFSGGRIAGSVHVGDHDPLQEGPRVLAHHIGFVFQDPESQCIMDRVEDDIAFVLENQAVPPSLMHERVQHILDLLSVAHLRDRRIETLSGGERQRVALAAALVQEPSVLVLDEPTSQLDPESAADVLDAIVELHRRLGLTVILSEHRLERVLDLADQVVLVHADGTVSSGAPRAMLNQAASVPPVFDLGQRLGWEPLPLTLPQAREHLVGRHLALAEAEIPTQPKSASVLEVCGLYADYGGEPVLQGASLQLAAGQITALMGRNGTGKTTLLRSIVGLHQCRSGDISLNGQSINERPASEICREIGYLPQRPDDLLFADTVAEELQVTLRNHGLTESPPLDCEALLASLGLETLASLYPRDLSVGQRQRVALAAIMVTKPQVLLLDEPTRGLDAALKRALLSLLRQWCRDGIAVLISTHDVELVAEAADAVLLLEGGHIAASGCPEDVLPLLGDNGPQMAQLLPGAHCVTVDQAVRLLN